MELSYCNVCGGALKMRFAAVLDPQTGEQFSITECEACGLGHTTPQPLNFPPYYGPTYHGGRHGFTARYCVRRRLRLLASVAGDAGRGRRLLDVGCGDGTFLLGAREIGWSVMGTELNPARARSLGLFPVHETIEEAREHAPFDCITLWHSLEHIRDPRATLRSLAGILAPGGLLVVAVPDAEGLQARLFGPSWFHLDVPRHLYHFGRRSLNALLEAEGFAPLRHWHQEFEYDLLGWSQSALNLISSTPNLFFNRLTGRRTEAGRAEVAASYSLGIALSALALPATAIGALSRRGGTLIVAASRKRPTIIERDGG
jgi:SAM-dependent methyltransferase